MNENSSFRAISILYLSIFVSTIISCNTKTKNKDVKNDDTHVCLPTPQNKFSEKPVIVKSQKKSRDNKNMVLIPGGVFSMGGDGDGWKDEFPKHNVEIDSFWMDINEVTNNQFLEFVNSTGYITTAERNIDWNQMKKDLPPNTPKPDDSYLVPSSLVFFPTSGAVNLNDVSQWWKFINGANWRQPQGPGSNIDGKGNHPVVHVSWYDAIAYCEWAGSRLPTEAEWEYASRGGIIDATFSWGNEDLDEGKLKANTWNGNFPYYNSKDDGFIYTADVRSFEPNGYGLFDMSGNVWEWCSDWYDENYYYSVSEILSINPQGPQKSYDSNEPYAQKKVSRGGSFLCHKSYCTGYRNSMRMKSTPDTSSMHTGFRTVRSL